ncbi:hypothetical protein ACA910_000354 [Epithemia clementina (nom. ined.)]
MAKKDGDSGKDGKRNRIDEPGELDVLCGRGGMSNHHPGNDWYRRLIKSNRPLYRACPKHTKLLVSKAIVQAVEQQGGRFLDKDRTGGFWFEVTYKRAVDKTSQGLRERERDDEQGGSNGKSKNRGDGDYNDNSQQSSTEQHVHVPDQFSGRIKAPNLSDLADLAIARATSEAEGMRRGMGVNPRGSLPSSERMPYGPSSVATRHSVPQPQHNMMSAIADGPTANNPMHRHTMMPAVTDGSTTNNPMHRHTMMPAAKGPSTATELLHKRQLPTSDLQSYLQQQQAKRMKPTEEDEYLPLPPSLEQRQSSMFRLLNQTRLLLQQSENWGLASGSPAALEPRQIEDGIDGRSKKYPTKLKTLNAVVSKQNGSKPSKGGTCELSEKPDAQQQERKFLAQQEDHQQAMMQVHDMQMSQAVAAAGLYGNVAPTGYAMPTGNQGNFYDATGMQNPAPVLNTAMESTYNLHSGAPVAPLTRLTSQMSDWLTSFWPVPASTRSETITNEAAALSPTEAPLTGHQNVSIPEARAPTVAKTTRASITSFERDVAPRITNVPPPRYEPVEITIPPFASPNSSRANGEDKKDNAQQPNTSEQSTRISNSTLHEVPGGPQQFEMSQDRQSPVTKSTLPEPTELEQSVSATLLKLAGVPSRFYSGVTSFFESAAAGNGDSENGSQSEVVTAPHSNTIVRGIDKNMGPPPPPRGLDPNTPVTSMVGTKRSNKSLLDDHEETPMEQRMRAASWKGANNSLF